MTAETQSAVDLKLFDRWTSTGIEVKDPGLKRYVTLSSVYVPRSSGRYAGSRFHKSQVHIVGRLINKLMVTGHRSKKHFITSGLHTGKGVKGARIVEEAFSLIAEKTKQNPVAVFVKALENAAPREEIIAIEYGGARYPKAVEVAPQRRVDLTLRYMTQGAFQRSFNKKPTMAQALADEILAAYGNDPKSAAISKKNELERQADSSR